MEKLQVLQCLRMVLTYFFHVLLNDVVVLQRFQGCDSLAQVVSQTRTDEVDGHGTHLLPDGRVKLQLPKLN